ncbi:MAG TPA: OsmC family protein [Burkholderiaceae bacterium]
MPNPIAAALERLAAVFRRRPEFAVHDDAPATATWQRGTRVVASHAGGATVVTDMAAELGGSGEHPTPGWMFRAGIATCTATRIAMEAALQGIVLTSLEVVAGSTSDGRGFLGMPGDDGGAVPAGACEVRLDVRIAAAGVEEDRLRTLVELSNRLSPMSSNIERSVPLLLRVTVDAR